MSEPDLIRVAVTQFHVGADIEENLATCLRMLEAAANCGPDLIVLPEFCNHLSWYDDKEHCYDVSVRLEGSFLRAIAEKARKLACHVVVNCTVQREGGSATGSSLLYSPQGELLLDNTKQIYIGHENDFLDKAKRPNQVVDTDIGRIGLYACMDGVINETPRCLALNGAQIILNSLNSFATDEASLHVPVRAAENKVFVVAANKVGPLVPETMLTDISAATGIPEKFLCGAGESQIVSPDGEVLARASADQEEFVFADLRYTAADNKHRPDGTDIINARRPSLYQSIGIDPQDQPLPTMRGQSEMAAAIVQLPIFLGSDDGIDQRIDDAVGYARQAFVNGADLVAIPPIFGEILNPAESAEISNKLVSKLASVCDQRWVSTAAVLPGNMGYQYCAVIVGGNGIVLQQAQLHQSERFRWSQPVDVIKTLELPFGRVGLSTSDDSLYPEYFRLLAMAGVEVAVVPLQPLEAWELNTGLIERAAENRINLLAATQPSRFGTSLSASLQTDFTVMTEWKERSFDGLLSQPMVTRMSQETGVMMTTLHPANAANKVVSSNTDLLSNRPWELSEAITHLT